MRKLVFISTGRNAGSHLSTLCTSIDSQSDPRWEHVVVDDMSDRDPSDPQLHIDDRRRYVFNEERKWALRNIVDVGRQYQDCDDVVVATVDADDQLCNDRTVELVLTAYEEDPELDALWTAHTWDIKEGMNVSGALPDGIDPYELPWRSSHLRTWRASTLARVPDPNFLDHRGEWFKRGYDQTLYLPLLKVARRRRYVDEVCYMYNMDSCSISLADRPGTEVEQLHTVAFVRARGFLSGRA